MNPTMFTPSRIVCRIGKSYSTLSLTSIEKGKTLRMVQFRTMSNCHLNNRLTTKLNKTWLPTVEQRRTNVTNILNLLEKAQSKCPKRMKDSWNYEHCNHFMSPKDYEFQEIRRQTEGDYGRIIWKFRDADPRCPTTYMPGCYTVARVDRCEEPTTYVVRDKRPCPYKSYAECYVKGVDKHKTECDACSSGYLPHFVSVLRPPSDCCLNCASQPTIDYKKQVPYSNHCLTKTNLQSCFWPSFKGP